MEFYVSYLKENIWLNTGKKDNRGNPIIMEVPVIAHPKIKPLDDKEYFL